jgi:hydrogenase maturation protease
MSGVRVVVLGNPDAADDGAALCAAARLRGVEVLAAGRPGAGLLDLLATSSPTVLVDVVSSGGTPGRIVTAPLRDLPRLAVASSPLSSHGFGPAETLVLGEALGRELPPGTFVGIEGAEFRPGAGMSSAVASAVDALVVAIDEAVAALTAAAD